MEYGVLVEHTYSTCPLVKSLGVVRRHQVGPGSVSGGTVVMRYGGPGSRSVRYIIIPPYTCVPDIVNQASYVASPVECSY